MFDDYNEFINSLFLFIALFNTSIGLSNSDKNDESLAFQDSTEKRLSNIENKIDKIILILECGDIKNEQSK
jgi:hypothetical protein